MTITKPTLDLFTGTENFGKIFTEQNSINIKYINANIPFTSTAGFVAFNFNGKTRIILLQGINDGDGWDGLDNNGKIDDFIQKMETWFNSSVALSQIFTTSFSRSYKVVPVDWQWTRKVGDPNRILWSLIMKQVAV